MKILLIRNDNIGDLICTTPAIEALRKAYPNAKIDMVVNSYNFSAIKNNPFVDKIYCYTKSKHVKGISNKTRVLVQKAKILFEIFKENYDKSVIFRNSYSNNAAIFARFSKEVIGVKNKKDKDIIKTPVEVDSNMHEVDVCYACLKSLNVENNGEKTSFYIDGNSKYKNYIFFHISSRINANKLSFIKLKELLLEFKKRYDKILITSDSDDTIMAEKLSNETNVIYLKTTSFDNLASYLKYAKFAITLDGGVMHLAPALDIKTISIFGNTSVNRWRPYGDKNVVLQDKSKIAENVSNEEILIYFDKFLKDINESI